MLIGGSMPKTREIREQKLGNEYASSDDETISTLRREDNKTRDHLQEFEGQTERDPAALKAYVVINYGNARYIDYEDDIQLWEALRDAEARASGGLRNRRGVVIVQSHGGSADVAYKMGNLVRRFFGAVDIVVPFRAKSAATLFCMCGDKLIMGPLSELGPLDVQTEHPGTEATMVSGLDVSQALNNILSTAWFISERAALAMRRGPGISRKDALNIGTNFGASVMQGLLSQIDPVAVSFTDRALQTASEYGRRLLDRYMLKEHAEAIDPVIHKLVEQYPTHTFAIDVDEASQLGLVVTPSDQYADFDRCWAIYQATRPSNARELCIRVLLEEELSKCAGSEEETDGETEFELPIQNG